MLSRKYLLIYLFVFGLSESSIAQMHINVCDTPIKDDTKKLLGCRTKGVDITIQMNVENDCECFISFSPNDMDFGEHEAGNGIPLPVNVPTKDFQFKAGRTVGGACDYIMGNPTIGIAIDPEPDVNTTSTPFFSFSDVSYAPDTPGKGEVIRRIRGRFSGGADATPGKYITTIKATATCASI